MRIEFDAAPELIVDILTIQDHMKGTPAQATRAAVRHYAETIRTTKTIENGGIVDLEKITRDCGV